jgi:hypothetical protein
MHIFGLYGDGGVVVQIKIASKVRGKKNYANSVIVVVVGGGGCCTLSVVVVSKFMDVGFL